MTSDSNQPDPKAPERKTLLDTSALIVGYAMSRLDRSYLKALGYKSWKTAFADAGKRLGVASASIKNLRDEFDPFHDNARHGWHDRPMRESRARVMGNLCDVSDAALLSMIADLLNHDPEAIEEVVIPLSKPAERLVNSAERLLTGHRAEEFFLANAPAIINVATSLLLDRRIHACGYDFAIRDRENIAIEVKGIKKKRGDISLTDREWTEAKIRRENFWLVIVGNLEAAPSAKLIVDPTANLNAKCKYQTTITAYWKASVAVA